MIHADASLYLWLAALLLFLPFDWVLSALTSALIHEFCHIAVLVMLGGKISRVRISVIGCILDAESPGDFVSFCSILAGPIGSMALLILAESLPKIAVCGLFHGLYNLLPVLPLDGGRGLHLILNHIIPKYADTVLYWIGWTVCCILFLAAIWFSAAFDWGLAPVLIVLFWIIQMHPRKIPCKPSGIGVQ